MVFGFFKGSKEKKIINWIRQQVVSNEDWRVMALGNKRLCPYCGNITAEITSETDAFDKIQMRSF